MLPRFVASTATPRAPVVDDPEAIEDVRAVIRVGGGRELVLGTAASTVLVAENRGALSQRARSQLSFHDVASGRIVELAVREIYVFDLQMLEMLPDAPGLNDALYLYGVMRGPFPARGGASVPAVNGQLIVTRADLLASLIDGVTNAFAYPPDQHGSRSVHAILPGASAGEVDAGEGVVLMLPLVPHWMLESPLANDVVAAQIFYDVLSALRTDLRVTDMPPLPVPSRAEYEQRLTALGWRIEGETAVRAKGRGIIGSIFKGEERQSLPRQGTLDELVAEAVAAMGNLPQTPELLALRRKIVQPSRAVPVQVTPPPAATPAPPAPRASSAPAAAPRPRVESSRSEWMKDFVESHRAPSRPAPRVVVPARAVTPTAQPAWLVDFATPDDPATPDDD